MKWHSESISACMKALHTDHGGLSPAQAAKRLRQYGPNELEKPPRKPLVVRFLEQFRDCMVLILLAGAALSFFTSALSGEGEYVDAVMILVIVFVNAVIGLLQESRAQKALDALRKMAPPQARVVRGGQTAIVPANALVPGDIVVLEAGDRVPADVRLLESTDLQAQESALTGESRPVFKDAAALCAENAPPADRKNLCYASTTLLAGHGRGLVVGTGMHTQVGRIARMLHAQQAPPTPLQQKLAVTGRVLGIGALALCACIFLLGLLEGVKPLEMFLTAVSLAVAAIPEGLPTVVTVVLAAGMRRMANRRAIVRRMMAVETLGSASVICSDKTGTLTENRMTVAELRGRAGPLQPHSAQGRYLLKMAALCTNCTVENGRIFGEPTEAALCAAVPDKGALSRQFPRVREIPFSSARKRMTVVVQLPNGRFRVIVKGAPEVLSPFCAGGCAPEQNREMARKALRVLAVAVKETASVKGQTAAQLEQGLTFLGLVGLSDPPRPQVKGAVALCRKAGIRPVMITGDHADTAAAVAREVGILDGKGKVLSGPELEAMPQKTLCAHIYEYPVFARVSPAHKVRIVQAFQAHGEVVAMTGDGVNDAPALKAADIGCAMGQSGTDVAKGAADLILADDNFATIVEAVREGRGIYQNIRRTIHFLLSCNVGELLAVFVSFLMRLPLPLAAVQLLWVNLVTDSLPALALGVEPIAPDVMDQKPVRRGSGLFAGGLGFAIVVEGLFIGALSLLAYGVGRVFFDADPQNPVIGRTMGFAVLSLSQLVHALNMRSERTSLFARGRPRNPRLFGAIVLCGVLMVLVAAVPALSAIFQTALLTPVQWAWTFLLSSMPLWVVELEKAVVRARRPTA